MFTSLYCAVIWPRFPSCSGEQTFPSLNPRDRKKKHARCFTFFPPPLSLTLSCFCSHPLHHLPFTPSPDPTHLCPSANEHQRQGPNPRGSPNPGDYPASSPPLGRRSIVLHSRSGCCDPGWDKWGVGSGGGGGGGDSG